MNTWNQYGTVRGMRAGRPARTALGALLSLGALALGLGAMSSHAADAAKPAGKAVKAEQSAKVAKAAVATPSAAQMKAVAGVQSQKLVRNGVVVEYRIEPVGRAKAVLEGEFAQVTFRITDEGSGQPLRASVPGAWMDMSQVIQGRGEEQKSCKDKIALYLKGAVGIRPMVDLNSYYVVLLNQDATLSVVDPTVSMAGATSTLASVMLKSAGADWAVDDRNRRLYVSQPKAGVVAVVDTEAFKVVEQVKAGAMPMRVALQPDGRYLWVGNNAPGAEGGVSVIDTATHKSVGHVATGEGHHEIAFSADSRHAYVTNRASGTVSVVEVATRKLVKQVATGPQPLSIGYSALSQALYVSDGKSGQVSVIDAQRHEVLRQVELKAGLGPLKVSQDGRHVLVVNPGADVVHVVDTASNEAIHEVGIGGEPYQLALTESFAYVRSLHSERVSMITLASLGAGKKPAVQSFGAGSQPPKASQGVAIADGVAHAPGEGTVFVVNPADGNTYYYMEGMNAPSTNYRVYGSSPRAVTVVDRSLKEVRPGEYEGRVRLPAAGRYDVAFMLQSPQVLHCFSAQAGENAQLHKDLAALEVQYETTQRQWTVGQEAQVRFRLREPKTGQAKAGLKQVAVMSYQAPGRNRAVTAAREVQPGLYEARVALSGAGAWYVYVGVPQMKLGFGELAFYSLMATEPATTAAVRP
jgi:YVTN family beta-propeller protein